MARPVRSAEIAELRAFCAAVDLGSLGRAARLLRVSQPALSKRLRALEAVAGARLLERSPRGVRPTPAGNRLYLEARKLLAQAEAVDDLMAGLSDDADADPPGGQPHDRRVRAARAARRVRAAPRAAPVGGARDRQLGRRARARAARAGPSSGSPPWSRRACPRGCRRSSSARTRWWWPCRPDTPGRSASRWRSRTSSRRRW